MTFERLHILKDESVQTEFSLANAVSSAWYAIGQELGVRKDILDCIEIKHDTDEKRLHVVWTLWINESDQIANDEKYPVSWRGLHRLLADMQWRERHC